MRRETAGQFRLAHSGEGRLAGCLARLPEPAQETDGSIVRLRSGPEARTCSYGCPKSTLGACSDPAGAWNGSLRCAPVTRAVTTCGNERMYELYSRTPAL